MPTAAQILAERLHQAGCRYAFGIPGGEVLAVMDALFLETNPIPVKTALEITGRIPDATLRLPLTEMTKTNRDALEATLSELGTT